MNFKRFWLFRTNLTNTESYHKYNNIKEFEKYCWDFYLIQSIWILRNTDCNEITIWRLTNKNDHSIKFKFGNKLFIQRFVNNFNKCFKYNKPDITFFRGGFKEYNIITKSNPNFFGRKLYLGASNRIIPKNGVYDKILVESDKDLKNKNTIPYYKLGVPNIFKPLNLNKKYDICWPCNFTQIRYKGQEYFIKKISESNFLRSLKIVHVGNRSDIGLKLCKKYNLDNIKFIGNGDRFFVNKILNESYFGLVTSNKLDGCPRISTEILSSGTPLLIRKFTRLLNYYKELECVNVFDDENFEYIYKKAKKKYGYIHKKNNQYLLDYLNIDFIMNMNLSLW